MHQSELYRIWIKVKLASRSSPLIPVRLGFFSALLQYGVWPNKCRQGSKTNKLNCEFWKKLTFDWLIVNLGRDLFGQTTQYFSQIA
jgi:hypothetical protein